MTSKEIRQKFLDFFAARGHKVEPSSSLVPSNDPTLLFTSAGMVQFKNMFLGKGKMEYRRAATCQKCFRTNDIERVGHTARHQTFFEMLGNFSFGDYFKKEAIEWAWEFLTKEMHLPEDKLYASIYKDDEESFHLWRKILPAVKIIRLGEEDNFWKMGDTGPCGPCSEILFDRGEKYGCGKPTCQPGCDCDRFVEIWNLVFTQFDRTREGELLPLPQKNIDTGMGLERLSVIMQNAANNFETDLLKPIIDFTGELANKKYGEDPRHDTSFKVIADHSRGITFLLADGVLPSNDGRGYVLRRILRRAVRHGKVLGLKDSFLYKVTGQVVEQMKDIYPELAAARQHIAQVTLAEEERFHDTLGTGSQILDEMIKNIKDKKQNALTGREAFQLYDTYGFPLDLTVEITQENDLAVDTEGFNKAMEEQKTQAREAWKGSGARDMSFYEDISKQCGDIVFRGYELTRLTSRVMKLLKDSKTAVAEAGEGENIEIILGETPFYGESGGQVGDRGKLIKYDKKDIETEIEITDTIKPLEGLTIHLGKVIKGKIKTGDTVEAIIDLTRRRDITRSHTATHILHKILRQVLGEQVKQAGSLVEPGRFRFDFNHLKPLKEGELNRIEELLNAAVRDNFAVLTAVTTVEEAKAKGAMALFGEKYASKVRLVMITAEGPEAPADAFSLELCGGTHVKATGEIGLVRLLTETSIASGVRRIEALVGEEAYKLIKNEEETLKTAAELLKTNPREMLNRLGKLIQETKDMEKQTKALKNKMASSQSEELVAEITERAGIKMMIKKLPSMDHSALRSFGDKIKDKLTSGVIVLAAVLDDNIALLVIVSQDLIKQGLHAGKIIKEIASLVGGSGGGKAEFAQAGAKDVAKLDAALEKAPEIIEKMSKPK